MSSSVGKRGGLWRVEGEERATRGEDANTFNSGVGNDRGLNDIQ